VIVAYRTELVAMRVEPLEVKKDAAYWVERLLRNWVTWMHGGSRPAGYPKRACGGVTNYTSMDLENVAAYENLDRDLAERTNACIDDLAPVERCAIYNRYLQAVFRFPRESREDALARAMKNLEAGLKKRGVWLGE
jgi:hypothetical protein